jgi:hypothetical protein
MAKTQYQRKTQKGEKSLLFQKRSFQLSDMVIEIHDSYNITV